MGIAIAPTLAIAMNVTTKSAPCGNNMPTRVPLPTPAGSPVAWPTGASLAVARDAGDGDDLAGAQLQRHARPAARARRPACSRSRSRRPRRRLAVRPPHRRGDGLRRPSSCGELRLGGVGDGSVGDQLAGAQHRDAVARPRSTSSSLWLMKTIDRPCATSLPQRGEQRLALLRRQHRGRLVEDQDAGAAVERLQDLDALALADRQRRRRARPGSTGRPKRSRRVEQPARAPRARRENGCHSGSVPSITLSSTLRLSASVKCWCTMPMPAASAAFGWPGGSGRPNDLDRAGVGDVVAEQDRHQRALAGAVLAEQRQHLAGARARARSRRWPPARRSAW